jgi:hypothetical protein
MKISGFYSLSDATFENDYASYLQVVMAAGII